MTVLILKKLLQFATSGEFLYKDKVYKQVDGVAMGSPLGPTLANLFLASQESRWTLDQSAPLQYLRYVDDIFAVFDKDNDTSEQFLQFLNSQHPNLRFTIERGPSALPFLDAFIDTRNGQTDISVYRKPTHTGLILNYSAYSPSKWKTSLIYCLLHRAFLICSSFALFHAEVVKLQNIFTSNGYPLSLFQSRVKTFLDRVMSTNAATRSTTNSDSRPCTLIIPFLGKASKILEYRMRSLCRKYNITHRILYKPFKVGAYFSLKSRCPKLLQSMIVYKVTCSVDQNVAYIGKTKRHLGLRMKEHTLPSSSFSAVFQHIATCNCSPNFTIIKSCTDEYELSIMEALFIREQKPSLNTALAGHGSSIYLKL